MKTVALAIFPCVQSLDVAGPLDVFAEANTFVGPEDGYEITLVGADRAPVRASNGLRLSADVAFAEAADAYDLLLVAGGPALPTQGCDPRLTAWLRATAPRCPRYGSICTGAFALGHAGLLDDRAVTTHWSDAQRLAEQFPRARVEYDRIHIRDGALVTSAGVTAGIDLGLALVHEDHGPEVALAVAKRLVVVAQRQGGQSQFSPLLTAPSKPHSPIDGVHAHVIANLRGAHRVEDLAAVAGMSARTFARAFKLETRRTPAEFVEGARIDAARNRLEAADLPLKVVAYDCGFRNAEHMRLVFVRRLGLTPSDYRARFRAPS
ncbi:AraC family transcriptional regulator [Phenylobacterium hankyongense]|uniref:AraC family transcriptional regulator n=1 Tax=Phenylobacterium hankyongense TaxID=1813876 RepID=A0A328AYR2_9CAUL|nr:GlxA family transcriptional regulator [Phenylobacterium hankyongense]RAK59435.1 AraC family transcriptional regulator [Phenylobacterium hankyongense]